MTTGPYDPFPEPMHLQTVHPKRTLPNGFVLALLKRETVDGVEVSLIKSTEPDGTLTLLSTAQVPEGLHTVPPWQAPCVVSYIGSHPFDGTGMVWAHAIPLNFSAKHEAACIDVVDKEWCQPMAQWFKNLVELQEAKRGLRTALFKLAKYLTYGLLLLFTMACIMALNHWSVTVGGFVLSLILDAVAGKRLGHFWQRVLSTLLGFGVAGLVALSIWWFYVHG